jgi:uncharacterized protein (TIGR02677 family)
MPGTVGLSGTCTTVTAVAHYPRLPVELFRFTTGERAELNTATLCAFGAANERLETWLTLGEVAARLRTVEYYAPVAEDELLRVLGALKDWQLIERTQDHGAHYSTAEDFERNSLRYSLTRRGEAALDGIARAAAVLEATGALQTAVLDGVAERLHELAALLDDPASPDRRVFATLSELEGHLESLVDGVKQFNGELQRLLRDDSGELDTFHDVKQATVAYLQEFVTNLDGRQRSITEAVGRIEAHGLAALHQRALRGADLPALPGSDPAPAWLEQRAAKWDGLRAWFRPVDGTAARVLALQDMARRAIVALMRVLERHTESRRHATSAAADFRALVRAFAACPDPREAHRLAAAAFGLWPSRHVHLGLADEDLVAAATSWADAPRVPVSPYLRTRGRVEHVARTAGVRDVAALRRARQDRAARERAELEAAWDRLSTAGAVRCSALGAAGELEHGRFERLLDLLGRALSAPPDTTGHRRGMTADGRVELVLRDPGDGARATLHTPRGAFTGPDYVLDIRVLAGAPARTASAGS